MLNPFASDAYSLVSMTEAINVFPNNYGKINQLGIFSNQGITSNVALVERRNGILNLIPSTPWGGPPAVNTSGKREVISVPVPHIPVVDVVLPSDVQGVRAFGTENVMETIDNMISQKLADMSRKHDVTLEYLRMGALKGQVIDGDGTTVLVNLFTQFNVTQKVINMALSNSALDVKTGVQGISRYFEDTLQGETMTGTLVLCSPEYWDALTSHPNVVLAYQYWVNTQNNIIRDDMRMMGFVYQGITFVEYRGQASLPAGGGTVKFVPANEAIALPLGTSNVFKTFYAPANFNETVNTVGLPKYAKQEERRMGQGWDLWTESNPLPIATRPDLIARLTKS
jgi:hypothetical protein